MIKIDESLYVLWRIHPELWSKIKFLDEESLRITGHSIEKKPLIWYEKKFEEGFIPKNYIKKESSVRGYPK